MVTLTASGNSVVFTFENSNHYLYGNGEIEVPKDSLILVIDKSDIVTFRKIDGDVFVSFNINDSNFSSKDEIEEFYKENMVGGGGIESGDVQTMIDESISGKVDTSVFDTYSAATNTELNDKLNKDGTYIRSFTSTNGNLVYNDGINRFIQLPKINGDAITYNSKSYSLVETSAITSSVTSASTDTEIPSAKAVWDAIPASITVDSAFDSGSTNPLANSAITEHLNTVESVIATSLVDLDNRKLDASAYTPTDLSNYYNKTEVNGLLDDKLDEEIVTYSAITYNVISIPLENGYKYEYTLFNSSDAENIQIKASNINGFELDYIQVTEIENDSQYSGTVDVSVDGLKYTITAKDGCKLLDIKTVYSNYLNNYITNISVAEKYNVLTVLNNKVDTSAIVTAVTSASTDTEIPSAKAVYDAIPTGGSASYSAGTDIDITNDVISVKQISGDSALVDVTSTLENETSVAIYTSAIIATMKENAVANNVSFYDNNGRILTVENNGDGLDVLGNTLYFNYSTDGYTITASTLASGDTFINISNDNGNQLDQIVEYFAILATTYSLQDFADNVYGKFSGYVATSAVTSSMTSSSTDAQVPSAKCVYDQLGGLKLQQITQAEYDALVQAGTVDASTVYFITTSNS